MPAEMSASWKYTPKEKKRKKNGKKGQQHLHHSRELRAISSNWQCALWLVSLWKWQTFGRRRAGTIQLLSHASSAHRRHHQDIRINRRTLFIVERAERCPVPISIARSPHWYRAQHPTHTVALSRFAVPHDSGVNKGEKWRRLREDRVRRVVIADNILLIRRDDGITPQRSSLYYPSEIEKKLIITSL